MQRIRCHFDGRAFVPEQNVDAPAGVSGEVILTAAPGGPCGGTMEDLLAVDASGWLEALRGRDTLEYAAELRRRASTPALEKQRAMLDLEEHWDRVSESPGAIGHDRDAS